MRLIILIVILGLGFWGAMTAVASRGEPALRSGLKERPAAAPANVAPSVETGSLAVPAAPVAQVVHVSRPQIVGAPVLAPDAVQPMAVVSRAVSAAPSDLSAQGTIRRVNANSINVRGGPSTGFPVVGRLPRGEEVLVVEADPSGWVRIRIQGDGVEGWVAARLLSN